MNRNFYLLILIIFLSVQSVFLQTIEKEKKGEISAELKKDAVGIQAGGVKRAFQQERAKGVAHYHDTARVHKICSSFMAINGFGQRGAGKYRSSVSDNFFNN